ncbi:hypothetical protein L1049_006139 [Liquidambar formosana]|uniref:RING-type E3 ubiquitin transferase n=1 Tax=Liquidambar formosana TaxID=63359 RepID=A0AAP0REY7_LIQFO
MGGCCCCSSKGADLNSTPGYIYCRRTSEELVPLSSHHGAASALSTGLLVDTNLETIDTYRPPPPPMPYDVDLGRPQTPPGAQEICGNKDDTANSGCVEDTTGGNTIDSTDKSEELKESDCKAQTNPELDSENKQEVELSKSAEPIALATEEEECPICLEEYDVENPKIIAACEHHFHLACILEWMERSDTCPACDQEMIFSPPANR